MDSKDTLQQAITHHKAGELKNAEQLYRSILSEQANHPDANHNLGVILKQGDKAKIALPFFKTALEANPNQGQYWISYINTLIHLGQYDAAQNLLNQGQAKGLKGDAVDQLKERLNLKVKPSPESVGTQSKTLNVNAILKQAKSHAKKGQLDEAKQLYHSVLAAFPQNQQAKKGLKSLQQGQVNKKTPSGPPKAQIDAVISLYSRGQIQEALRTSETLIKDYPNTPLLYNINGACYKALGQLEAALKSYEHALAIKPDYAEAHSNLGNTLKELSQLGAAVKSYEQALAIKPDYAEAHSNLGVTLNDLGQLEAAVKSYEQAIAIKPDYAEAHSNLGNTLKELGQLEAAVKSYEQALAIKPDYAEAHNNLGLTYHELGQLDAAVKSYEKALAIKPDLAEAHYNLGNTLKELRQLAAAVKSYEQALAIKPDYAEAHTNLGITLQELGQLEAAVKSYEQALAIKPDFAEAYSNLGITLRGLGQLDSSVKSYEQALAIKPNYAEAWNNVFFTAKALNLPTTQNTWLASYKKKLDVDVLDGVHLKILEYRLNAFIPHSVDGFFDNAINALPLKTTEDIQNPSPIGQSKEVPVNSTNTIALIHFGRSGTGLLHSLIDNHPKISTLPSIYFSEYYNAEVWGKLIAQGWDQLPENFIKQFAVLFDARSSVPVPNIDKPIPHLGQKEGMANVGINRDEVLTVDQSNFCTELRELMADHDSLTPQTFFTLVHSAYEKALDNESNKQTIFYHIHNPSLYAKLNFLRYNPEARLLMIVREPVQSCESWVKNVINESSENIHNRIVTMLFDIDQIAFRRLDSIGVRLEDLKTQPEATMAALCDWMGIKESPTLYEMTAQGKKWWGDPTSPDYSPKGMSPFDDSAITRKVGNSVFSEQDQFILRTLFYPFRVRFGYVEENLIGFKEDLKTIKPLLDQPFGFQEKLAENLNQDLEAIMRSGSALYFRGALHARWAVLDEFNDYPHMLKPLTIQES
jgi:tetratricopeptide (TPR) repeat protein